MRLWTLHPGLLDSRGLVALWREGLLAQKVLRGETRGYRHHPQLQRFRAAEDPVRTIADFLLVVNKEAAGRGYRFDASKIAPAGGSALTATQGQLEYEWAHLLRKVRARDAEWYERIRGLIPGPHPQFTIVPGPIEEWEKH